MAVVAFAFGLHWGAIGVAAAYSLLDLVVRTPLLFHWSDVAARFRCAICSGSGAAWAWRRRLALALFGLRHFAPATLDRLGQRHRALLTLGVTAGVTWSTAAGRRRARFGGAFASTKGGLSREGR